MYAKRNFWFNTPLQKKAVQLPFTHSLKDTLPFCLHIFTQKQQQIFQTVDYRKPCSFFQSVIPYTTAVTPLL